MEQKTSEQTLHYHSSNLAIVFARQFPMIAYLSLESPGRGRGHLDTNLLRPGLGGGPLAGEATGTPSCVALSSPEGVTYSSVPLGDGDCLADWECEFPDDRTVRMAFRAKQARIAGAFFRLALAPDVTAPSLWARPVDWTAEVRPLQTEFNKPRTIERQYRLPGLVSFPDFGLLQIDADAPGLTVTQRIVPDPSNAGMNLGFKNVDGHTPRKAYHKGHVALVFEAAEPFAEVALTFTVRPELYPQIEGCDLADAKWDGLRRCWMNGFTLNPPSLSLGDNFLLGGCGHLAIHWKSDMSVLTPDLLPGLSLHGFFRSALQRTFEVHTDESGKMTGYGWENGACNLIALHAYLLGTGDWDFARQVLPAVRKVIEYNLALDADDDGILEAAYHGNDFHGEKTSLNWWDVFAFGHKDAYGNLVYHQAFRRVREVLAPLGETDLVSRMDAFLSKTKANFHQTFFNEDTGVYAGWISRDGRVHDYYFTFIAAMAINEGLTPDDETARQVLQRLLDKLVENGYGEFRYGVPGPAAPVDPADRLTWGPMGDWGWYEHGGFCGQTAYHFLMALYRVGMREQADRILFNMLDTFEHMPTQSGVNPGYCQSWDWRTRDGLPCGYNYLADNYVFLLAAIQGHFDVDLPPLTSPTM